MNVEIFLIKCLEIANGMLEENPNNIIANKFKRKIFILTKYKSFDKMDHKALEYVYRVLQLCDFIISGMDLKEAYNSTVSLLDKPFTRFIILSSMNYVKIKSKSISNDESHFIKMMIKTCEDNLH